jgi:hypothetical protein
MKVRLLKDWNFYKVGQVADVFDPLARNWIQSGLAEEAVEARAVVVERAEAFNDGIERAVVTEKRRKPKEA